MKPIASIHRLASRLVVAALIAGIGLHQASAEETTSLDARTSASSVQVAESFSLELTVAAPSDSKVTFASTGKRLGDFEVLKTQDEFDIPDANDIGTRTWTRRLTLESIVTGQLNVPAVEVLISNGENSQVIHSNPIPVQVVSVLEDRGDPMNFRDIQSVVDVAVPRPVSGTPLRWALGSAVSLALFAVIGVAMVGRGKWMTPKARALKDLDELYESVEPETSCDPVILSSLSTIVRHYLIAQLSIAEVGNTGVELVQRIESQTRLDGKNISQLRELFALADQANFAGLVLSQAGLKSAIHDSRNLVRRIADEFEAKSQRNDSTETK